MNISYKSSDNTLQKKSGGFTIIETLVAITVMMIAIAGPLVVATKGLASAQVAKNQMIASYLAQETMEVVKNERSNFNGWLFSAWSAGSGSCNSLSSTCDTSMSTGGIFNYLPCSSGGCPIYYNEASGYTSASISGSRQTPFKRYFYWESIDSDEVTLHVFVDWNEGTVPYQIHITSQLLNTAL